MRVLHITPALFGAGKRGGGERYVSELVRAQRDLGLDVEVAVVPSIFRATTARRESSWRRPPLRVLAELVQRAQVVHVHQLNTPGFDYAAVLCRLIKRPLVLTDHGGGLLTPGRALGSTRLRFVNAAAFVSSWSRKDVDPRGAISPWEIVFGGGDHLPSATPSGRHDPERFDFLFVGRLLPHKGAHIALESLPRGSSICIAGEARDPSYLQVLKDLATGKDVTFEHDVADNQLTALYRSARMLVVPSVRTYGSEAYERPELLGLVALEALCAGTRVIASDVGGLGEVMRAAGQTVVPDGDVAAWTEAMSSAMRQANTSSQQPSPMTWERVARQCVSLYERVL